MKTNNKVVVTHGEGAFLNAKKALASLDLSSIKGKSILIKPNMGRVSLPKSGINTSAEAIAGVIEALKDANVGKIAIGESPILGVKTLLAFEKAGLNKVAEKYGVELIDMDSLKPNIVKVKDGRILDSTKLCAHISQFDIILSLPVAKTHMHTGVTLGIKNMKGCLYKKEKVRYHQLEYREGQNFTEKTLDSAISDLATLILPDITVLDGFIGMEGLGPSGGEAKEANFALASFNPLGADTVGVLMMGLVPEKIPHLKIISERLGYSIDKNDYDISPSNWQDNVTKFKETPTDIGCSHPDVVLCDKESCSACLSTVMLFLKRFKVDMDPYRLDDGKFHMGIGLGVRPEDVPKGTVLIGNCAKKAKSQGVFVPGCPPVSSRIYKAITGKEPPNNEPEIS